MKDVDCVALLRWMLPRLRFRWDGFRRVRGQVCKRLSRRIAELGLDSADDYREYLTQHSAEWRVADSLCTVTISRFYRDKGVFGFLGDTVLPALAARAAENRSNIVSAWSVGCSSGEEPYSLALVWQFAVIDRAPGLALDILGTDIDAELLRRAREGRYPPGCLKELPDTWRATAFETLDNEYRLRRQYRDLVRFCEHDLRTDPVDGPFDLVLCRNLAFTYFDADLQRATAGQLRSALRKGGALVLGAHESLPGEAAGFSIWSDTHQVYRKTAS
jgi:chemotaxis protein methyltransferase CheR